MKKLKDELEETVMSATDAIKEHGLIRKRKLIEIANNLVSSVIQYKKTTVSNSQRTGQYYFVTDETMHGLARLLGRRGYNVTINTFTEKISAVNPKKGFWQPSRIKVYRNYSLLTVELPTSKPNLP